MPAVADDGAGGCFGERRDDRLEIVLLVAAVRLDLAQVPVGVACGAVEGAAKHGAATAVFERHLLGQNADAGRALDEDVVTRQERMVLLDARLQVIEELAAAVYPAFGQVI